MSLVDYATLAAAGVETPFFLFDRRMLMVRARRMACLRKEASFQPYFMAKANWLPAVLAQLSAQELGIAVTSELELSLALGAGVPGARLSALGPAKSRRFLERCVAAGVGLFLLESVEEARALAPLLRRRQPVGLRVQLDVAAHGRDSLLGRRSSKGGKFGIAAGALMTAAAELQALPQLSLTTLSTNLGSQICDPAVFHGGLEQLLPLVGQLRRRGIAIDSIDLGGGLPIAGLERRFSHPLGALARAITGRDPWPRFEEASPACEPELLVSGLQARMATLGLTLVLEPGRWLVADCMQLVTRIDRVVERRGRRWLFVDGGIDMLPDAGFGQRRPIRAVSRADSAGTRRYVVAGPLCMKGDVFADDVLLPANLVAGDFVLVGLAGAYGFSRASWFGGRLPSVVGLEAEGLSTLWRAPSAIDLLAPSTRAQRESA